jgi:hypothetical protein
MLTNPLHTNPEHEQRVRERAYHLWETDGKPHGRDVEYWQRAREQIATEDSAEADGRSKAQSDPGVVEAAGTEEAEIRENPGAFVDSLTDQGDVPPVPVTRRSPARRRKAPAPSAKKPRKP